MPNEIVNIKEGRILNECGEIRICPEKSFYEEHYPIGTKVFVKQNLKDAFPGRDYPTKCQGKEYTDWIKCLGKEMTVTGYDHFVHYGFPPGETVTKSEDMIRTTVWTLKLNNIYYALFTYDEVAIQ